MRFVKCGMIRFWGPLLGFKLGSCDSSGLFGNVIYRDLVSNS